MIMISLDLDLEAGASVGSPVGIDAPLRRIVAITQKNIAKDITTIIGPMRAADCSGAKLKGTIEFQVVQSFFEDLSQVVSD